MTAIFRGVESWINLRRVVRSGAIVTVLLISTLLGNAGAPANR